MYESVVWMIINIKKKEKSDWLLSLDMITELHNKKELSDAVFDEIKSKIGNRIAKLEKDISEQRSFLSDEYDND